jgi:enoyl-[acyl-carrier-protein] reductase (NADH)
VANEISAKGVKVNPAAPATFISLPFASCHEWDVRNAAVPLKRTRKQDELGEAVAFFTPHNAGCIPGQIMQLDGA